ncbi:MAG: TetR/AcrR family transcriptional regulator [Ignavibacteriales bacterium]|nr:TetR/AcrR family transcriptional regulator [Ignavibacteriales bacterium]
MRHKEGNKEKDIIEAAIKCFAKKGYHHSKIIDIAKIANVAVGSIYVYYNNKEDILIKIFNNLWERLYFKITNIEKNSRLTPVEKIDTMIEDIFDAFIENPNLAIVFVNEQQYLLKLSSTLSNNFHKKYLDVGEIFIKEGIQQNIFSSEINSNIFRIFILGAIRNLLRYWADTPVKISLAKIKENVTYLIRNGILKK